MSACDPLPEYLSQMCEARCRTCYDLLGAVPAEGAEDPPAAQDGPAQRPHFDLLEERCRRCYFLLLLEGITKALRGKDVPEWMERPNPYLDGHTPRERIDAGDYLPVFEALWLQEPEGPV